MLLSLLAFMPVHLLNSQESVEGRIWYFLQKYSPNSYYLVKKYVTAPERYQLGRVTVTLGQKGSLLRFVDGESDQEIIASLNTLVHEVCHGYTSTLTYQYIQQDPNMSYKFGDEYFLYFIDSLHSILVPKTPVFSTNEIHRTIPKQLRSPRYETYIHPEKKSLGAQVNGVYGLLDEWNAYYHGTRTDLDLFDYYAQKAQSEPSFWLEFFSGVNGTYYAHLEFKFYTLKYLMFARDHHPQIYDQILSNKQFIAAFLAIDRSFSELINQYFERKKQIFQLLKQQNVEFSEDEDYVYIGYHGRSNFLTIYHQLAEELDKANYRELLSIIRSAAESN